MERPEGEMSLKNRVTSPGIDPGTFRLVAQRLYLYATPGPRVTGVQFYFPVMSFFPVSTSIILPTLDTHFQLNTTRIGRTSGRILENCEHNKFVSDFVLAVDTSLYLHFFLMAK